MSEKLSNEAVKDAVRRGYALRVTQGRGCCGGLAPVGISTKRRELESELGYEQSQTAGLPDGAVANAFGCGNPLGFAGVQAGDVVLDIGSGAGIDCLLASRIVGASGKVIGLDMTPEMIDRAKENARQAGADNIEFRQGDAEAMPVEDGSVHWVISNCVINLAPDKKKVFREVARVLKPGGRVAISDIMFADDLPELSSEFRKNLELLVACIGGAIREGEYLAAMKDAGLVDVEVTSRMPYGEDHLRAFAGDGLGANGDKGFLDEMRRVFAGRVWSARVVARKPDGHRLAAEQNQRPLIRQAQSADQGAIEKLLALSGLPLEKLAENLSDFLVAEDTGLVVGCVGAERYGTTAVLRSLAVHPDWRRSGLGIRLSQTLIETLRKAGMKHAVLLTSTARNLATKLRFVEVQRSVLDEEVQKSWEFASHCCGSATCMKLDLS